jgi:hypothetical protein
MTINNFEHLQNSVWDWAILNGCFGESKIKVSDIDGIVESKGKFIIFECKFRPSDPIPTGQELMIKALTASKLFTVVVLWGDKTPEQMKVYYPNGLVTDKRQVNLGDLRDIVTRWYNHTLKEQ